MINRETIPSNDKYRSTHSATKAALCYTCFKQTSNTVIINHLRQRSCGGTVIPGVCLSVCLSEGYIKTLLTNLSQIL